MSPLARRDLVRAFIAGLFVPAIGCRQRARPEMRDGRVVVTFWYAYGD